MFREKTLGTYFYAKVIVKSMPPFMCQGTGPVHLRKIDDFAQRLIMSRRIAAAPGAESDRKRSLIGNVFVADLQGSRQIFERFKPHIEGNLPVILVHPVPKFTAAESKGIKVMLPGNLHAISVIRSGPPHMG